MALALTEVAVLVFNGVDESDGESYQCSSGRLEEKAGRGGGGGELELAFLRALPCQMRLARLMIKCEWEMTHISNLK